MNKSLLGILIFNTFLHAQIQLSYQLNYQLGNLPNQSPKDYSTYLNVLQGTYTQQQFSIIGQIEQFASSDATLNFNRLSQLHISGHMGKFLIDVGNFYTILGRGTLLRMYKIPGSILEDPVFRVRYPFYKDLLGAQLQYLHSFFSAKFIKGRPLNNTLPPTRTNSERRPDDIEATEIIFSPEKIIQPGIVYLKQTRKTNTDYFSGVTFSASLNSITLYSEYIHKNGRINKFKFRPDKGYGFYQSLSYIGSFLTLTFDYKDYHQLFLPFNEPPAVVREHSSILLNRTTHVVLPQDESGFQIEAVLGNRISQSLTINYSSAVNEVGSNKLYYKEFYLEISKEIGIFSPKIFTAQTRDDSKLIDIQHTLGIHSYVDLVYESQIELSTEFQTFQRKFDSKVYSNFYSDFSFNHNKWQIFTTLERSTDIFETDNPNSIEVESAPRFWSGIGGSLNIDQSNLTIYYGKRRGGLNCISGICYEVLDFEGLEFTLQHYF